MSKDNKTEQPTAQRRQKAREQGQVARSRDLAGAVACALTVWLIATALHHALRGWQNLLANALDLASSSELTTTSPLIQRTSWAAITACAVPLLSMLGISGFVLVSQGGFVFAPEAMQPKFERLSPASRLGQMFSMTTVSSLLKSLIPGALITAISVQILTREWSRLASSSVTSANELAGYFGALLLETGWKSALVMVVWSAADYLLLRKKLESDLRMSKDEVREELKQSEGNPATKGRIRKLQRQARRARMLQEVEQATVVVTNPTHFAVALQYTAEMAAPVVLAKGQNLLAQQIRQKAYWVGIPVVENKPLAQALYRTVEIGRAIPADLYAAVAEVLAFVFRMKSPVVPVPEKGQR